MYSWSTPDLIFGKVVLILLQLLFVALQVLHHQVFASQLVVVGEMVDDLVIGQSDTSFRESLPDFGLKRFLVVQTVAQ